MALLRVRHVATRSTTVRYHNISSFRFPYRWYYRCNHSFSSFADAISKDDDDVIYLEPPLVELQKARLSYNNKSNTHYNPIDLKIDFPTNGGHALLGRNSSGKSLVGQTIASRDTQLFLKEGTMQFHNPNNRQTNMVEHVSFDSHLELLEQGGTTHRAINGGHGGTLTKAAQFLVVRFGLYPLLTRNVRTLSTGEIRKVLLVRALSNRPKLLILDNAFDGLDVPSRDILKDIVQKTIDGFTQDILVQGVNSQSTAHTQILLLTHRPEEVVDAIQTVSWFDSPQKELLTEPRNDRSGVQLLQLAMSNDKDAAETSLQLDWDCSTLPSKEAIQQWWYEDGGFEASPQHPR